MAFNGVAMACFADQPTMGAFKFKIGGVVIELPERPAIRVMTARAVIAERLLVYIVLAVAVRATRGNILEGRGGVTLLAGRGGMQADQRELGQVMIEYHLVTPAGFSMATRTVFTLLAEMHIIGTVTINTACFQLIREAAPVTGIAQNLFMLALQWEVGLEAVIEAALCPRLLGMAGFAALAVPTMMCVVCTVAADTGGGQLLIDQGIGVTGLAGKLAMAVT